ncbi:MAG: aldo/keto reductase [Tannerella sp.]|jgi:hypothetical protein|nr:aldo/keto reductase [Tannerella sp.]
MENFPYSFFFFTPSTEVRHTAREHFRLSHSLAVCVEYDYEYEQASRSDACLQTINLYMDALAKAWQDGIVKAVGISGHHMDALNKAATDPRVNVIRVRINLFGSKMEGSPDEVNTLLEKAKQNGKGIIAMKVFGEGTHVSKREQPVRYAVREANAHGMTPGLESETKMPATCYNRNRKIFIMQINEKLHDNP